MDSFVKVDAGFCNTPGWLTAMDTNRIMALLQNQGVSHAENQSQGIETRTEARRGTSQAARQRTGQAAKVASLKGLGQVLQRQQ